LSAIPGTLLILLFVGHSNSACYEHATISKWAVAFSSPVHNATPFASIGRSICFWKLVPAAILDEDGNLTVLRRMGIRGKPTKVHRVGIVTQDTADSITIQEKQGNTYTLP